jgi:hypothetical protein
MKRASLLLCMCLFAGLCPAQVNNRDSTYRSDYYLMKSITQKRTGFSLLGVGAGLMAIGAIVSATADHDLDEDAMAGALLIAAGGLSVIASIPFFISSNTNKKRSLSAGIQLNPVYPDGVYETHLRYYPALSVSFSFGKLASYR